MNKIILLMLLSYTVVVSMACAENKAAENNQTKKATKNVEEAIVVKEQTAIKEDSMAIGSIETSTCHLKLHRAFSYPKYGSEIMRTIHPKKGYWFIYLDVSLRNKSTAKINGGFLFIELKVTDEKGVEYNKPASGLAALSIEHPKETNAYEYNALWDDFDPNEFHRDIIYCVEVPTTVHSFLLHLPVDQERTNWKTIPFTVK